MSDPIISKSSARCPLSVHVRPYRRPPVLNPLTEVLGHIATNRNTVERRINKVKAWRGLATRYNKTSESYMAGLQLRGAII